MIFGSLQLCKAINWLLFKLHNIIVKPQMDSCTQDLFVLVSPVAYPPSSMSEVGPDFLLGRLLPPDRIMAAPPGGRSQVVPRYLNHMCPDHNTHLRSSFVGIRCPTSPKDFSTAVVLFSSSTRAGQFILYLLLNFISTKREV